MMTIDPKEVPMQRVHNVLQGVVAPRPIALASTMDHLGNVNLSPFSFFNLFSINPPVVIFSPARRARDNSVKHTYENVLEVPEVAISIVDYSMVQQTSLSSVEFERGVNEFGKSGLTPMPSARIRPPRVAESPASLECIVKQVIPLGDDGGAGNLVVCEVLLIHLREEMLDDRGNINPHALDAVGRMGNDFYVRASNDAIFSVPKPNARQSIGYDQIPERIRRSRVLTGNDLGHLGNIERLPDSAAADQFRRTDEGIRLASLSEAEVHKHAQRLLREHKLQEAWIVLLSY